NRRKIMFHLIGQLIFGLIVGLIAKTLMPGRDPGGAVVTALIGVVGAFIGSLVGQSLWGGANYSAGWVMSIAGSLILLSLYRLINGRSLSARTNAQ
ncbi:MAG: GlsB/YeaQ/YmgE family stress response membrane protein, partial [Blastocatellia bacterium]